MTATCVVTMLMMRPLSAILVKASRIKKYGILLLIANESSYSFSVVSASGLRTIRPAVLTRMSHLPKRSTVSSTSRVISATSVRSP